VIWPLIPSQLVRDGLHIKLFCFSYFLMNTSLYVQFGYNFFSVQWLILDSSIRPSWIGTFILDDKNNPASKTLCLVKPKITDIVWSKSCFLEVRMKSCWTTVNVCKHYESSNIYLLIQHRHSLMLMLFTAQYGCNHYEAWKNWLTVLTPAHWHD